MVLAFERDVNLSMTYAKVKREGAFNTEGAFFLLFQRTDDKVLQVIEIIWIKEFAMDFLSLH